MPSLHPPLHLLFYFIAFAFISWTNAAPTAAAGGKVGFPKHLSFDEYKSILSFAIYEDSNILGGSDTNENEQSTAWYNNLISQTWSLNEAAVATNRAATSNNIEEQLFPFIICHIDEPDLHGFERYDAINSVLSKEVEEENNFRYFIKRIPIYNHGTKSKSQSENEVETFYGTCFYSAIEFGLAKSIDDNKILVTPVVPSLKMRKNISGPSEDYDEESLDKDTISLVVMLAPGIFSSHDEVMDFASNIKQPQDMDQNNSFLSDCDEKPYQRSPITVGSSDTSYYFFYEFKKPDLVAGITHRCHRLFLEHIVTKPQVISVEKVAKNKISNHHARWTVESGTKDYRPFSDVTEGLNGKGETVFVADTGLDEQHCYLRDYNGNTVESTTGWNLSGKIDRSLRKVIQYIELDDIASDREDGNGHGTHIVASIVGKRLENGEEVDGLGDGVANGALISFYDGNDGDTSSIQINSILSQFFYFPRMAEAKIISASFNSGEFGEYDDRTRQVDEYFHNDPDDLMLMFNSAGNDGGNTMSTNYGTTKYPCISKNVLCVGSSLNYHSDMSEIDVVAYRSSYGPTKDGRIKPDIVSPGEWILSANANANGCGPNTYPESVEEGVDYDGLVFKRGTSMACPIAAGAGALVRQYFEDGYYPTGSKNAANSRTITGTLLKAVLINGAIKLTSVSDGKGGYVDTTLYDGYQGFGRLHLLNSLKHNNDEYNSPDIYVQDEKVLKKEWHHEYAFNVCDGRDFRVTIVWRDPPGTSGCSNKCLINDIDLEVVLDEQTYYPNGKNEPDRKNNVERVILSQDKFKSSESIVTVKVTPFDFGDDTSQKYSLVSTGCFDNTEVDFTGQEPNPTCEDGEFELSVELFTDRRPEETSWILKKQGIDEVVAAAIQGQYKGNINMLHSIRYEDCIDYGCYLFIIRDTESNGLCCEKGMGSYLIRAGDSEPIEGDSFERENIKTFCYYGDEEEPTSSPTDFECNEDELEYQIDIKTDLYPDETRWELLREPRIHVVDKGNYTESYREYTHEVCLDLGGCYSFFVNGDGEYTIKANEFVVAERETFSNGKYEELCYAGESINSTPTYGIRTSVVGSNEGEKFDDVHPLWEYGKIAQIELYVDYYWVYFIGLTYADGKSFEHGWKVGTRHIITLGEEQYITKVSGRADIYIRQIKFETNDGEVFGPYGGNGGDPFEFDFGGNVLVYIFGRADDEYGLDQLGFAHASLPQTITDSPTAQPTSFPCGDNQFRYEITIRTDDEPEDVWWELHYIVDSIPFMTYRKELESYTHRGCFELDKCYAFLMIDRRRDGLCCYFGSGSYKLSIGNNVVAEGTEFDDANIVGDYSDPDHVYNMHEFCYVPPPSESNSPTINPTEMTCGENQFKYTIRVRTDAFPDDTRWVFGYANYTVIESVEEGGYFLEHYEHNHTSCIPLNECYQFYISASNFRGLCCFYGNGGYTIFVDDIVMAEGGEWEGLVERKTFCYGPSFSQSPSLVPTSSSKPSTVLVCDGNEFKYEVIVTTDEYPDETSWELLYDDGTLIDGVDFGEYTESFTEHVHNGCLDLDSCVIFTIFDWYGDGIRVGGGYTIFANDDIMAGGGVFVYEETKTFCYGPSVTNYPSSSLDICEIGSNNNYWCGYWASIGACENSGSRDWMQENCAKACSNCCMDYNDRICEDYASEGRCTDTSLFLGDATWQEWMQGNCRVTCETCDLDFTPSPTPPPVICSDNGFKYEIHVTNDDYYFVSWILNYKYSELVGGYVDGISRYFPPNYEKRYYGCVKYSCFDLHVIGGYSEFYDADTDTLLAQNIERAERLRFCRYSPAPTAAPVSSALIQLEVPYCRITLEFSTSPFDKEEDIQKVIQTSIRKIIFRAQTNNENLVIEILDVSCGNEQSSSCNMVFELCTDTCSDGEDLSFRTFFANTMNGHKATGELLLTLKQTADHMDVEIFADIKDNIEIDFIFEYEAWPTTSPSTTLPSLTPTIAKDSNMPEVTLFGLITNLLRPITQGIINTTNSINNTLSDILFGVESYNSSAIPCADKMFELYIEIQTDGSPNKTSWELLYENGTLIESIEQDTYSECDTFYNHSYCLEPSCFVFNMYDSFEFKGSYNITAEESVLAQHDSFMWWRDSKHFCYPQCDDDNIFALQIELVTDDWPQETSWDLAFDNGTLVDHVDTRYYTQRNSMYNHRYCLYDGCYDVTFHDHIGDGMCCSYGKGSFKMKINDDVVVIREGGKFEESLRKSFCHITAETGDEENNSFLFGIITDLFGDESCCTTDTTGYPTPVPTISSIPSSNPSLLPSLLPSSNPSTQPSSNPSSNSSILPSSNPSFNPTTTFQPSFQPSSNPTEGPPFDPSSILVTYWDEGNCGPRGDDAQADLSQCDHGYYVVEYKPNDDWKYVAFIDGCGYFSYTIYECYMNINNSP